MFGIWSHFVIRDNTCPFASQGKNKTYFCRKHGVRVLGTIITEWGPGKQLLERILASDENIERFTAVTASMCVHYGFHGWLLNIENEVEPELVSQLIKLTRALTEAVKSKIGEEGVVLWYDSVTIKVRPSLCCIFTSSYLNQT